jgi:AcrR family transcriptional regulator
MEQQTLRERRRALIEDDILNVAQELIAEKGYTTMSMDELAARVGISKPTLYGFYRTKSDLVVAAISRGMGRGLSKVQQIVAQEGPPLERLAAVMRTIIGHSQEGIAPMLAGVPEMKDLMHNRCELSQLKQQMMGAIILLLEQARQTGELADDLELSIILQAFGGIVMSCFHREPGDPAPQDSDELTDGLTRLFIRGIRAQAS